MCRRAQSWGPSTGRGGLPSRVPGALGLGHQTPAVYTGREGSSSAREGTWQRTQIRSPSPAVPPGSVPGCTAPSAPASGRGRAKFPSAQRTARLTCEARHERAEPEQTGVEGRGHPRHGARRSAGARSGDGAGPRPGTAAACRALALGLTAPAAGLARAPPPPSFLLAGWDARNCRLAGRTLAESPRARSRRPFPSPSAAGPHSPRLSPPLSPAGRHSVSLRLGGTGRGELRAGPAPPCAGDPSARLGPGVPRWLSHPTHLGGGEVGVPVSKLLVWGSLPGLSSYGRRRGALR